MTTFFTHVPIAPRRGEKEKRGMKNIKRLDGEQEAVVVWLREAGLCLCVCSRRGRCFRARIMTQDASPSSVIMSKIHFKAEWCGAVGAEGIFMLMTFPSASDGVWEGRPAWPVTQMKIERCFIFCRLPLRGRRRVSVWSEVAPGCENWGPVEAQPQLSVSVSQALKLKKSF